MAVDENGNEIAEQDPNNLPAEAGSDGSDSGNDVNDGGDGASAEVLLAGKYKTPEELEKGYKELQSHATRVEQELSGIKKTVPKPGIDKQAVNEHFQAAFKEDPLGAMEELFIWMNKRTGISDEIETTKLIRAKHELSSDPTKTDFKELEKEIDKILEDNPYIPRTKQGLTIAYHTARSAKADGAIKSAFEAGKDAMAEELGMAHRASVVGGPGGKPGKVEKSAEDKEGDDIVNVSKKKRLF